jgi:hypothetical protein
MERLKLFLILFSSLLAFQSRAQFLVSGSVKDSLKYEPVAYVTVGIIGSNTGTITNELGRFILRTTTLPVTLRFQSMGYQTRDIVIHDFNEINVILIQTSYNLQEVTVTLNESEKLFTESYKKLQKKGKPLYDA